MTKHYVTPEIVIIELRLKDVIMQSDEWETPILFGANDGDFQNRSMDLNDPQLPDE